MQNVMSNTGQDNLLLSNPLQAETAMRHSGTTLDNETISVTHWGPGKAFVLYDKGGKVLRFFFILP